MDDSELLKTMRWMKAEMERMILELDNAIALVGEREIEREANGYLNGRTRMHGRMTDKNGEYIHDD